MFNSLTDRFQDIFRNLTGRGLLTEANIREAMEKIRTALLDADVNYDVATSFVQECQQDCLGEKVLKNVKPGEMAVNIVYHKLADLMGEGEPELNLAGKPSVIMLCGLHGSGKTTTSAKLARFLRKRFRQKVMLVACDLQRPAAIDQLETLGKELDVPVFTDRESKDVPQVAVNAIDTARKDGIDVVILDTAGRLQIDEELVQELVEVKRRVNPDEILLGGDAALGQEAVSVADHFNRALGVTGIILTKLDGDARGGAALSMHRVTGKPIKFLTVGERPEDLEMFHADRMAQRILGMGDVISLVERMSAEVKQKEMEEMEEKLRKQTFGFDDFLKQLGMMRRMGGLASLLKFLPGMNSLPDGFEQLSEKEFTRVEGFIHSMTLQERRLPEIINQSRRIRIAKGCGATVQELNQLLKQFAQMKSVMAKLTAAGPSAMGGLFGGLFGGGGPSMNDIAGIMGGMGGADGAGAPPPGMGGMGGMGMGGMPGMGMPGMGGYGGYGGGRPLSQSQQNAARAAQQKRLEKKKAAEKQKKKNRRR